MSTSLHSTLHALVARFALTDPQAKQLWQLAELNAPPQDIAHKLSRALIVCAALLLGAGVIFWIAANWQDQSRTFKFGLLQGALVVPLLAAWRFARVRTAALLLATLVLGALLAFMGQTYQTGADPWQLFALWAALSLPWMFAARRDVLWVLWVLICGTAIGLWAGTRVGDFLGLWFSPWWTASADWLLWLALVVFAWGVQRFGFAGDRPKWMMRVALVQLIMAVTTYAITGLFGKQGSLYFVGVICVVALCVWLWLQRPQDLAALCVAVLGVDVLLIAGFGRFLFETMRADVGGLLLLGLVAAAVVGASVVSLLKIYRGQSALSTGDQA